MSSRYAYMTDKEFVRFAEDQNDTAIQREALARLEARVAKDEYIRPKLQEEKLDEYA